MEHSKEYEQALLLEKEAKWEESALAYEQMLLKNETVFCFLNVGGVILGRNTMIVQ